MKNILWAIVFLFLLNSCSKRDNSEVIRMAVEFARSTMDSSKVFTDSNGVITIGDYRARYVINPAQIFHGSLYGDKNSNVLVTIDSLHDPYLVPIYHLIFSIIKGEPGVIDTITSDMRVLDISNGIITADIPTHIPESPLYYCSECRDTVQFQYESGKLIRVKNLTGF